MEWLINDAAPVIAKILIVLIFPFSGIDKIINWKAALKQANSSFMPGGAILLRLAQIVEFVTPVCIVFNWYAGLAAIVLAGYCAITGILYHNFWSYPRFWSADSEAPARGRNLDQSGSHPLTWRRASCTGGGVRRTRPDHPPPCSSRRHRADGISALFRTRIRV